MDQMTNIEFGMYRPNLFQSILIGLSRYTLLGRGFMRRFLKRLILNNNNKPFDVALWGGYARLYPHENISEQKALLCPFHYDKKELQFLKKHLTSKDDVFFDIGANAGLYSFYMASQTSQPLEIHLFEPEAEMMRRIQEKFALTANQPMLKNKQIHLHPFALGTQSQTATLVRGEKDYGGAYIEGNKLSNRAQNAQNEIKSEIVIKSFVDFLNEFKIKTITALKIDVEGYEDRIIKQLFEKASESVWPKALSIEHISQKDWEFDCINEALNRGYSIELKTRNNTALLRQ